MIVCDSARTAELLDYHALVHALARAVQEHDSGVIVSPERTAIPLAGRGVLLSMPAVAPDIAVHKLVIVQPHNVLWRLPTIQGCVTDEN